MKRYLLALLFAFACGAPQDETTHGEDAASISGQPGPLTGTRITEWPTEDGHSISGTLGEATEAITRFNPYGIDVSNFKQCVDNAGCMVASRKYRIICDHTAGTCAGSHGQFPQYATVAGETYSQLIQDAVAVMNGYASFNGTEFVYDLGTDFAHCTTDVPNVDIYCGDPADPKAEGATQIKGDHITVSHGISFDVLDRAKVLISSGRIFNDNAGCPGCTPGIQYHAKALNVIMHEIYHGAANGHNATAGSLMATSFAPTNGATHVMEPLDAEIIGQAAYCAPDVCP